ncbi:hypothetical protein GFS60_07515 (plasmid) [Rhodococcus sp. WAY2]|nr:hypothetical protein GFS60_07515 [Rhodococcus sp. WAY2]
MDTSRLRAVNAVRAMLVDADPACVRRVGGSHADAARIRQRTPVDPARPSIEMSASSRVSPPLERADRDPPLDALIDLYKALVAVPPLRGRSTAAPVP